MLLGADVFHPAPGSVGRPSFAALVGSVDSEAAKYVADVSVQDGSFSKRIEMITGLKDMTKVSVPVVDCMRVLITDWLRLAGHPHQVHAVPCSAGEEEDERGAAEATYILQRYCSFRCSCMHRD